MRILLLLNESWNDITYPNNNMTNWFEGMEEIEIFTISGEAEYPVNSCCKDYFILSDMAMVKSFFSLKRAGDILRIDDSHSIHNRNETLIEREIYEKRNSLHKPIIRLVRDAIWRFGRIDKKKLAEFLENANPDIIFSQRKGNVKMCRLEYEIQKISKAPMVAYTGDNEYLQDGLTGSLIQKLHYLWIRHWLDKMIPTYKLYYSMSEEQMGFYKKKFRINTKFLVKSGEFSEKLIHKTINTPIKLVYAGKLYCGRGSTLCLLTEVIKEVNNNSGPKFLLDIYTGDTLNNYEQNILINQMVVTVHKAVSSSELLNIYSKADIVLHVEGLDQDNVILTKYSFSTKIMDCLSSGASVLAVCNPCQAGYSYLKRHDIAFTASDKNELKNVLEQIQKEPELICEYSRKAYVYGCKKHNKKATQTMILRDFEDIINENISS